MEGVRSGLSVSWWWTFCAYLCTKFFYVCPAAEIWVPHMIRLPAFEAYSPLAGDAPTVCMWRHVGCGVR